MVWKVAPPLPVELRSFSVAVAVALAHTATACLIVMGGLPTLSVTPLAITSALIGNQYILAAALLFSSLCAAIPFLSTRRLSKLKFSLLLAPQQLLLLLHFTAVVVAITLGQYPDGYAPKGGGYFIAADQIWMLTIVFFHTMEYLEVL